MRVAVCATFESVLCRIAAKLPPRRSRRAISVTLASRSPYSMPYWLVTRW
jgi:hypothetical protein